MKTFGGSPSQICNWEEFVGLQYRVTFALILNIQRQASPTGAAGDVANAEPLAPNLSHGLLDVYLALQAAQNSH